MTGQFSSRSRIGSTTSWSALALIMVCGVSPAYAQVAGPPAPVEAPTGQENAPPETDPTDANDPGASIVVIGTRASQQSAIDRKRRAKTATDSIVADDIGSFPDRNVSEAMSRLPGVALNRGEFGEGEGVSIRGNDMSQTRVELDGVGVQSTFGLALGIGNSRGADLREIPAELVKSIDVVKGTTADMTEGSIGGGVQIETRSGLDFKKPFYSIRIGGQRSSLSREITPDLNAVATRKFFNDRLGIIASGSYVRRRNDSHRIENTTSGNRGYAALFDFDQSPEKTFEFNPATVGTDAADVAFANSLQADGTPLTPREFVTLAAGAQTKAECLTLFPNNATATAAQRGQRILEQQSCLNQWNDRTPSLIRHFVPYQDEKRITVDVRADFRVTDNFTIHGKITQANRRVDDQFASRNPVSLFRQNEAGTFNTTTTGYPRIRTLSPAAGAGFYLFPDGLNNVGNNATYGNVLNVVPGSVTVDEDHNVTQLTTTRNRVSIDQIANDIKIKTRYAQVGGEWRLGRLEVDGFAGMSKASTTRTDWRTNRTYEYGDATLTLQPNGLWDIDLPDNYDEANIDNYVQLNPAACTTGTPPNCQASGAPTGVTVAQMPLTTPNFSVSYSPRLGQAQEKLAKFDATYDLEGAVPFLTRFKTGVQFRRNKATHWGSGGRTIATAANGNPAIILPRNDIRGALRGCQDTPGSLAPGGQPCAYGYTPEVNPAINRQGVDIVTPDELRALFESSTGDLIPFLRGLPDRGSLPPGWREIRSETLFRQLGAWDTMNFDCLKRCVASDGQTYDQPFNQGIETTKNIYGMFDFEQPLPMGLLFNGNVGVRGVFRNVTATGPLTLNLITTTPAFNPANPNAPAGIVTQSFTENIDFKSKTKDWLPSVNLNLWAFGETVVFRAYGGRTVAQPNVGNLVPAGNCTIDARQSFDGDGADSFGCGGRVGNPALKPFTARSRNLSLEWYPNRDTLLSVAHGRLNVVTGGPVATTETKTLFGVNPITGESLGASQFVVPTWENGPGFKRRIWEFSARTAFTFLPWYFRYTGADANVSMIRSKTGAVGAILDPLTGDIMPPAGESKRFTNLSVWYDDGRLNLRVAVQRRSPRFDCITPCGGNNIDFNYPGEGWSNVRMVAPGYSPGIPRFIEAENYIDAKTSYNVTRNIQLYFEVRNLTKRTQLQTAGDYSYFADTPTVMKMVYAGRRLQGGINFRFGSPE